MTSPARVPKPSSPSQARPAHAKDADAAGSVAAKKKARGTLRELVESLSLAAQFRLAAVASVLSTLLLAQLAIGLWQAWLVRERSLDFARQMPAAVAANLANRGAAALAGLASDPAVLAAHVSLPSGEVLDRYARSDAAAVGQASRGEAAAPSALEPATGWPHRALAYLALEPLYIELPVQLSPHLLGSVGVLIDHRPVWRAAFGRIVEIPVVMALGCLFALLVAGSLDRQVVKPLAQLATATRVGNWTMRGTQTPVPPRRNELTELATNFDALADRLADYEKDLRTLRLASRQQIIERTKQLEMRLRAAEALTRSKDDFLANMSHEIRTPMNGVLGMTELLAGTRLDQRQKRYVQSMRTAAETMMQIINDILDDSKIEAGKMDLVREPFDVRELVEDVGQLFAGRAEEKKLELICRVEPDVPTVVVGDVLRLRQVLGNLVSNAVKYTERGEIQVRAALDVMRDGNCRLFFGVSDTGPGIAEAQHAAIFEAFKQLEHSSRIGGTGLGLSIASRLVQLMGGTRIDLLSRPGHGSSFSFVLPFEINEATRAPDAAANAIAGMRVLVVDDNATSYMFLEETLANWSADVTVLNHGHLLAERLRSAAQRGRPFDVVLLDHGLPDATTSELLRSVRLDPAVGATYIVLLSAFDFDPTYEGQTAIGPDMCIAKPIRQQLLKSALLAARSPRGAAAASASKRRGALAERGRYPPLGLDVLVVDDNAVNREVAVAMLEACRCKVAVAEEGSAAVKQVHHRRFDVILMDCQMPGMDGYAATAAIRRDEAASGAPPTPIVALTANVMSRDRDRCLASGMNAFLGKPFTPEELVGVLQPIAEARGTLTAIPPDADTELPSTERQTAAPAIDPAPDGEPVADAAAVLDMLEAPLFQPDPATQLPVLDGEQVRAIRGLDKPLVFERLCELLFAMAPGALKTIETALAAGDLTAAAAAAHSFKSAASNLGGRRLAEQLDRCESAIRDGADIAVIRTAATGLRHAYAALELALKDETGRKTGT